MWFDCAHFNDHWLFNNVFFAGESLLHLKNNGKIALSTFVVCSLGHMDTMGQEEVTGIVYRDTKKVPNAKVMLCALGSKLF